MKYRIVQEWDREILARAVQQWIERVGCLRAAWRWTIRGAVSFRPW